jgi:intracellular sulfur oxidation DsrE/DsrF family protein
MVIVVALLLIAGWQSQSQTASSPSPPRPVGLEVKDGIKVVYQIKTDGKKDGIGEGLYYVKKLIDAYEKLGITESERKVHAVFHGEAGYWLLKDPAYGKEADKKANPTKEVIGGMLERGVSLELCASTMLNHGWERPDVLEGVTIVVGAYPRIIDLQTRGYAYIRY